MARTVNRILLNPSRTDKRPLPIPGTVPGYSADLGLIGASQIDEDSVILLPQEYIHDRDDSLDDSWRGKQGAGRCWQTTVIYEEQISENHPHLVPYLRRDPWTAFPVLAKPSGPPATDFIQQNRATMYSAPLDAASSRILGVHRPLMYQWALHIISGLSFIHAHDIIFGELNLSHCWLSSDLHLSLVGFVNAGFWRRATGVWYDCTRTSSEWFHPLEHQYKHTTQTDLFLYGCVVYELMTGFWPGDRTGKSGPEIAMMVSRKEWPPLETEHMGEIVRKCWAGDFEDAKQLKAEVVAFLEGSGWSIDDDNLQGLGASKLSSN
ncbi:kinase-like domain-containing protein [Paraphoma chrysanthemicola]|uniref:Kinase-like domain-containing protein n=1 Tax=Paraphoma chrysanthemicola TaxID=798071 RepID=A0A8K0QZP4_9PLEO|nr:kinase-like domain-containing protein [Paraphoma chrysanthemicola]